MSNDELPSRHPEDSDTNDEAARGVSGGPVGTPGSSASERGGAGAVSGDGQASTGESPDAAMSAKKKGEDKPGSFWKELPILIVIALVLAFIIKTWVVQAFYIPSKSMEDTLLIGDRVLVNKLVYEFRDIRRGDVIVFNGGDSWDEEGTVVLQEPTNPVSRFFTWVGQQFGVAPTGKDYIKRVVGLPGDTVECCDAQNRLLVNGEPLDEDYLYPGSLEAHQEFGPVTVPEGRLWVMGDHRAVSYDSRMHQSDNGGGSVSEESVVGRAFVIVWPLDRFTTLPVPDAFEGLDTAAAPLLLGGAAALPARVRTRRAESLRGVTVGS